MNVYVFVESPTHFIDEWCFETYEDFCKAKEECPDWKFGKPRFDTKSILRDSEE